MVTHYLRARLDDFAPILRLLHLIRAIVVPLQGDTQLF